ncbi:LytTR family DNA-binding domain-containing protein [Stenotrophomonas sp. 24(2023)]|uniref:LytR/AlgR family response regulator transcription factor n=1 Tax=Stenotrophomonas sp. 24(2023) TaxID=3068324 RepID=UPI0027DF8B54|nr:LytTR family DNA-binding domain-containing protein [Stenotrophomonas sp. 24(2023)]WMJ68264.1 LytTR family DNA-binding domain-containing protein [Stenotrophomonas sp. 24(2023)]
MRVTALIADDEPLLRQALAAQLAQAWPQLQVVAQARNGRDALQAFETLSPQVCFLDIHMPGLSGIDVAARIARRALVVFVTAYDAYAVQAFAHGALDYLVKPVEPQRLADTVQRLQQRLLAPPPLQDLQAQLQQLAARLSLPAPTPLRWLHAQVGSVLKVIPCTAIDFLRADSKYTRVGWRDDEGRACDAVVTTPLKDLLQQLDPDSFVQVHRSAVVNRHAVRQLLRGDNETAQLHLRGRDEVLPVSRRYLGAFRAM